MNELIGMFLCIGIGFLLLILGYILFKKMEILT